MCDHVPRRSLFHVQCTHAAFLQSSSHACVHTLSFSAELDQFWSAKFLEDNDKAITALQRKEALKVIDVDNSGKMALIEYLVWKFKKSVSETNTAPQVCCVL